MKQYLLSVHLVDGGTPPAPEVAEVAEQMYADVDTFNAEAQSAGAWVFGGGLHPIDTATVVRATDGDVVTTDGPFAETKEHLGGFWVIQEAAINAVHTDAPTAAHTDWGQILQLYDQLLALTPTPVVALNRAVALAEVRGPGDGLAPVEELDLDDYFLFHSTRAELLRRLGRPTEAAAAYDRALTLVGNEAERHFLQQRRRSLG
jgi:hypothetical protein